jgi:hypothetical protein
MLCAWLRGCTPDIEVHRTDVRHQMIKTHTLAIVSTLSHAATVLLCVVLVHAPASPLYPVLAVLMLPVMSPAVFLLRASPYGWLFWLALIANSLLWGIFVGGICVTARKHRPGMVLVLLLFVIAGLMVLQWCLMLPPLYREHSRAWNPCCTHLRMIDGAKAEWAATMGRHLGDVPVIDEVNEYIKGNNTPACPRGGMYTYNPIGEPASCSIGTPEMRRVRLSFREWECQELHVTLNEDNIAEHRSPGDG